MTLRINFVNDETSSQRSGNLPKVTQREEITNLALIPFPFLLKLWFISSNLSQLHWNNRCSSNTPCCFTPLHTLRTSAWNPPLWYSAVKILPRAPHVCGDSSEPPALMPCTHSPLVCITLHCNDVFTHPSLSPGCELLEAGPVLVFLPHCVRQILLSSKGFWTKLVCTVPGGFSVNVTGHNSAWEEQTSF